MIENMIPAPLLALSTHRSRGSTPRRIFRRRALYVLCVYFQHFRSSCLAAQQETPTKSREGDHDSVRTFTLDAFNSTAEAQSWVAHVHKRSGNEGRRLRVIVIHDPPFVSIVRKTRNVSSGGQQKVSHSYSGFAIELLELLRRDLRFEYEFVNDEPGGIARSPFDYDYTNTLRVTGDGAADMFVAGHFLVPWRLGSGPATDAHDDRGSHGVRFLLPYASGGAGLLVRRKTAEKSLVEKMLMVLRPFSWGVWAYFGFILAATSGLIMYLERDAAAESIAEGLEEHDDEHKGSRLSSNNNADCEGRQQEEAEPIAVNGVWLSGEEPVPGPTSTPEKSLFLRPTTYVNSHTAAKNCCAQFRDTFFLAGTSLTQSNWFPEQPKSSATKVLLFGFSLVSLVFVAVYTAMLTFEIMNENRGATLIETYVCIQNATYVSTLFERKFPEMKTKAVRNYGSKMFNVVKSGACEAFFVDQIIAKTQADCDVKYLPATEINPLPYAFAVSRKTWAADLAPAMDYQIAKYMEAGVINDLLTKAVEGDGHIGTKEVQPACSGEVISSEGGGAADAEEGADLEHMGGLFLLYGFVCVVALVVHCHCRARRRMMLTGIGGRRVETPDEVLERVEEEGGKDEHQRNVMSWRQNASGCGAEERVEVSVEVKADHGRRKVGSVNEDFVQEQQHDGAAGSGSGAKGKKGGQKELQEINRVLDSRA